MNHFEFLRLLSHAVPIKLMALKIFLMQLMVYKVSKKFPDPYRMVVLHTNTLDHVLMRDRELYFH